MWLSWKEPIMVTPQLPLTCPPTSLMGLVAWASPPMCMSCPALTSSGRSQTLVCCHRLSIAATLGIIASLRSADLNLLLPPECNAFSGTLLFTRPGICAESLTVIARMTCMPSHGFYMVVMTEGRCGPLQPTDLNEFHT